MQLHFPPFSDNRTYNPSKPRVSSSRLSNHLCSFLPSSAQICFDHDFLVSQQQQIPTDHVGVTPYHHLPGPKHNIPVASNIFLLVPYPITSLLSFLYR